MKFSILNYYFLTLYSFKNKDYYIVDSKIEIFSLKIINEMELKAIVSIN